MLAVLEAMSTFPMPTTPVTDVNGLLGFFKGIFDTMSHEFQAYVGALNDAVARVAQLETRRPG